MTTTISNRFIEVLSSKLGVTDDELGHDVVLETLDVDSLALIELNVAVQKEFGVVLDESEMLPTHTVGQVLDALEARTAA